jgi:DNA replication protein DnaC
MPRGVPKSGVRMTAKRRATVPAAMLMTPVSQAVLQDETDEQIEARLNDNYEAMFTMAQATALGMNKSLVISGPAGVGKSHTVNQILENLEDDKVGTFIKGYAVSYTHLRAHETG